LLDRRSQAHRGFGADNSVEWAIELAASVCVHLLHWGRTVTLVAENGVVLAAGRDPDVLLSALTTLRPSTQPGLVYPVGRAGELFAILGAVDAPALQPLLSQSDGGHGHAVLMDVRGWCGPQDTRTATGVSIPSRALTDAGWSVLVARPDKGPDKVWNEFCKGLPLRMGSGQ